MAWTPDLLLLLGTMSDLALADQLGFEEIVVSRKRQQEGIPSYRSKLAASLTPCSYCAKSMHRRMRDRLRSRRIFCSRICADAAQKTRDSEGLRYGPGWKKARLAILERDRFCRACGNPPPTNMSLHVHHLKPYRFGGTNNLDNLVAVCKVCHPRFERITNRALESIRIDVSLDGSVLTVTGRASFALSESVLGVGGSPESL